MTLRIADSESFQSACWREIAKTPRRLTSMQLIDDCQTDSKAGMYRSNRLKVVVAARIEEARCPGPNGTARPLEAFKVIQHIVKKPGGYQTIAGFE